MGKFQRSWALLKCALRVIGMNKKLLLFPVLFLFLWCVAAAFFILPILLWNTGHAYSDPAHWQAVAHRWVSWNVHAAPGRGGQFNLEVNPAGYVLIAVVYLLATFLATFFNVAFYSQILSALRGRSVSVSDGFRVAVSHLRAIVVWSLFTGAVGLIIRAIEERVGIVGRWIVGLLGVAWSVASVFVVPAIIVGPSTANPLHYLKTSATMLKKTWGESLLGYLGIRFGGLLIFLGSLLLLGVAVALSIVFQTPWIVAVVFVLWLPSMLAINFLMNVASQVFLGALYLYAAEGAAPAPFDAGQMNMAWKRKRGAAKEGGTP